jgi:hypothetical protein
MLLAKEFWSDQAPKKGLRINFDDVKRVGVGLYCSVEMVGFSTVFMKSKPASSPGFRVWTEEVNQLEQLRRTRERKGRYNTTAINCETNRWGFKE